MTSVKLKSDIISCSICDAEYFREERQGKGGKIIHCQECAEEYSDVERYSGNMVFSHKTSAELQINNSSKLTNYINNSTKLKNKGSNMHSNTVASSRMKHKTEGLCKVAANGFSYKNRTE